MIDYSRENPMVVDAYWSDMEKNEYEDLPKCVWCEDWIYDHETGFVDLKGDCYHKECLFEWLNEMHNELLANLLGMELI